MAGEGPEHPCVLPPLPRKSPGGMPLSGAMQGLGVWEEAAPPPLAQSQRGEVGGAVWAGGRVSVPSSQERLRDGECGVGG